MKTRHIAAVLVPLTATAFLLTGCTPGERETESPTSSATPSSSATSPDGIEKPAFDNACDGDQAVISGNGESHALAAGCTAVSVVSTGSTITIGAAESLIIEGSNNDITVASVDTVVFLGSNNKLHVDDGAPAVDDQGTGNTLD